MKTIPCPVSRLAGALAASLLAAAGTAHAQLIDSDAPLPAQAAATGYAVYSPKGGFTDISANATLSYGLTPHTTLSAGVITKHLLGDAQDSPVTRKVTATTGQLGLNYAF